MKKKKLKIKSNWHKELNLSKDQLVVVKAGDDCPTGGGGTTLDPTFFEKTRCKACQSKALI